MNPVEMKIPWTVLARIRLLETADTIQRDKPGATGRCVDRILPEVSSLAELSRRGKVVTELDRANVGASVLGNYRVIYRTEEDEIGILTSATTDGC